MKRIVGDTTPLNGITYIDGDNTPLDWTATGYTPKLVIETEGGTVTLAATSITPHPTPRWGSDTGNTQLPYA